MFSSSSVQTGHLVSQTSTQLNSIWAHPAESKDYTLLLLLICLSHHCGFHSQSQPLFILLLFFFLRKKLDRKPVSIWQTSTRGNSSVTSSCAHSLETPAVLRPWRENPCAKGPSARGRVSSECQQREPWTQMLLKALFTTVKS